MPQFVPMTLRGSDGEHTFKPRDITGGVATLVESTGVPIGDRRISLSTTRTATGKVKLVVKFAVPKVEQTTVNGVTRSAVTRTNYAEVSLNYDGASTTDDRATMAQLIYDFFDSTRNPMISGYAIGLEGLY